MKTNLIKTLLLMVIGTCGLFNTTFAQYDAMFTQYMNNEMFINPAYAGSKEALSMTLLHRQQWVGFAGRPITTTFSVNAPVYHNKMGLGLSFLNEKIGVLNHNLIYASYAYRIKTGKKGFLSFGLMGGIHLQSNKLSEVSTTDVNDPEFAVDTRNIATPNFGFGIYYYTGKFFAGLSIPRMIDDNLTLDNAGTVLRHLVVSPKKFHYYLTVGRAFTVSPNFMIKPMVLIKAVSNAPVEFDIDLSTLIHQRIWLGAAYRSNADISAMAGIQITPQFLLSYAYDYPITEIRKYSLGSHEICLSYLFSFKGQKIVSPRYF
jgi:type IX secretion system PorP/SprF family membrane protein